MRCSIVWRSYVWMDLSQFKSSIEQQLHSLASKVNTTTPTLKEDLLSNISTMVETNLQSSLSSMSETAQVSITTFMAEQQHTINTFLDSQATQIKSILSKLAEGEETTRGLRDMLQTYEATTREQTKVITKLTEQNQQLQLAVEASNLRFQQMMAETPYPGRSHSSVWPPSEQTNNATSLPVATTPQIAGMPKSFWTSILPSSSTPASAKDIPSLPPPDSSEPTALLTQKTKGVFSLLKSMPQTPASKAADTLEAPDTEEGEIVFSKDSDQNLSAAETPTCHFCNEADIGLMYCDRCINPTDLFHESCLIWVRESRERVCMQCLAHPQPLTQLPPTAPTVTDTGKQPSEHTENSLSDTETDTIASPSLATTTTSTESYTPNPITKIFSKPSKTKLLSKLKEAIPPQPDTAPLLSPRKTRSKSKPSTKSKKKPQDAYDTPEEDEK